MYSHKYNTSSLFSVNKKMSDYLRFYQNNIIKCLLKNQTPKSNTCVKLNSLSPIDPNAHLILFPLTNIFCFLAGYYSHYFLKK